MITQDIISSIKDSLGITLTATISQLGFAPDECGSTVKHVLAEGDEIDLICLGVALDESREKGNWSPMKTFVTQIAERKAKKDNS